MGTSSLEILRVAYKSFPFHNLGIPEQTRIWRPVLPIHPICNNVTSPRFEATLDTGSDYCLFPAIIGASIGIRIHDGAEGDLSGAIGGPRAKVYYHNVKLAVAGGMVDKKAGFSWDLTENLLGYFGFFETF